MAIEGNATIKYTNSEWKDISCFDLDVGDVLDMIGWALGFIWAGVILLAETLGYLDLLNLITLNLPFELDAWSLFFLGAAAIAMVALVLRLVAPGFRKPWIGDIIFIGFLLVLGTGAWGLILAFFAIIIGGSILLRSVILS